ncbi:MAG: thiamine-monophosphate kinase [Frankiales bacterium]|nr:thiamine-monophosphate kinase [Frankiales bacterium]
MGELGEFALIARVIARLESGPDVVLGPGDDAAVVAASDGRVVATTDVLVDGRHFRRDWSTAYDVGRRAAAANLADIAAMGARATALLIGLGCPADLELAWADGLADGLRDEAALCNASVVGGDVVRSDVLTIAVTALGDLNGRAPVTRAGAQPGDIVGVAGRLGWAAAGLRLLQSGVSDGQLPDALRRPAPPYALGPVLAEAGATAMVDVSDGLAADLGHIAEASGVRIDLGLKALRTLGADGVTDDDLLTGGDDHALAFTIAGDATLPDGCIQVGTVSEGSRVHADGEQITGGHEHFGASD